MTKVKKKPPVQTVSHPSGFRCLMLAFAMLAAVFVYTGIDVGAKSWTVCVGIAYLVVTFGVAVMPYDVAVEADES